MTEGEFIVDSEAAFLKLRKLIESLAEIREVSRADMDEIAMLSDACSDFLPEKFIDVVIAYDKAFPASNVAKVDLLVRLIRILDVADEFPIAQPKIVGVVDTESLLPTFQLKKADKDRVLELCTDMRKIIFSSDVFDDPHKRRLLNRVAGIEHQIHQPKGLFDVVRGGMDDIGETLGKFGREIKPLTDRMGEVVSIARKSTKEYDQLLPPEEMKKLPKPSESESE